MSIDINKFRMATPFYKPNGKGKTVRDIIEHQAVREFELYQLYAPNTFDILVNDSKESIKATLQDVTDLEVRSDTKIMLTSVNNKVYNGDVFTINNEKWLCIYDKFKNTQNCCKVKVQPCNYIIKIPFYYKENNKPFIYEAPVVINPYLSDVRDDKQIMPIDSTIIYVNIRYDEYTKQLVQQNRIFIYGKAWQIAGIDMTNVRFPLGKGCMQFTCRPIHQSNDLDNLELGVCDYYKYFSKPIIEKPILKPPDNPTEPPKTESITLTSPKDYIDTFGTLKITADTIPANEKVIFMFDGKQNKCRFIEVTDNSCTIKADSTVGTVSVKAYLQSNATVIATKRISIKNDW